jgi:hypothetical protein
VEHPSKPVRKRSSSEPIVASTRALLYQCRAQILAKLRQDIGGADLAGYDKLVIELFPPRFGLIIFMCTANNGDCAMISRPLENMAAFPSAELVPAINAVEPELEAAMMEMTKAFFVDLWSESNLAHNITQPIFIAIHDEDERPLV